MEAVKEAAAAAGVYGGHRLHGYVPAAGSAQGQPVRACVRACVCAGVCVCESGGGGCCVMCLLCGVWCVVRCGARCLCGCAVRCGAVWCLWRAARAVKCVRVCFTRAFVFVRTRSLPFGARMHARVRASRRTCRWRGRAAGARARLSPNARVWGIARFVRVFCAWRVGARVRERARADCLDASRAFFADKRGAVRVRGAHEQPLPRCHVIWPASGCCLRVPQTNQK
jgi:hypothetical protein